MDGQHLVRITCTSLRRRAQRPMGVGGRAWRAGKKRDSRSATFLWPMRCATSRVILKYGSCGHRKRLSLHVYILLDTHDNDMRSSQ